MFHIKQLRCPHYECRKWSEYSYTDKPQEKAVTCRHCGKSLVLTCKDQDMVDGEFYVSLRKA